MTARVWSVQESLEVPFPPQTVYAALADVRRMTEWSRLAATLRAAA